MITLIPVILLILLRYHVSMDLPGTPPRVDGRSLDYTKMIEQGKGEEIKFDGYGVKARKFKYFLNK